MTTLASTTLTPYLTYRDSGVPWLNEVPEHWTVPHLRHLVGCLDGKRVPLSASQRGAMQGDIPYWGANRVIDQINAWLFDEPLVLLGEDGAPFFDRLRDVAFAIDGRVWVNNHTHVLRCRPSIVPRYLARALNCVDYVPFVDGATRDKLTQQSMGAIPIPLPPPDEQAAIVRYLDHADRRIRRFIRAKQQLIALLEEQKQAIIHQAVTRGLDPDVRLKPSGVEWLGDIPEHWEVRRVKALLREVDRRSTHGREVLLSLRMKQGLVPHNDVSSLPIPESSLVGFKQVEPGQVVMNRMRAAIGLFGVPGQSGLVSPDYAVFEPRTDLCLNFYLLLFKTPAMCGVFRTASKGLGTGSSGFMRLYTDQFGAIAIPVPPDGEQHAIAQRIDTELAEIDRTEERLESEINLLREYRTRLIADVVTGKLDVREAASRLPEETDEPELLDDLDLPTDELDHLDGEEAETELAEAVT